jgi:hypothetical protein
MTNRLPYETSAGNLSETVTYSQLIEHLRLASEAAYVLGHYKKANDDDLVGQGFLAIGQLLERAVTQVTNLATKGVRQ